MGQDPGNYGRKRLRRQVLEQLTASEIRKRTEAWLKTNQPLVLDAAPSPPRTRVTLLHEQKRKGSLV